LDSDLLPHSPQDCIEVNEKPKTYWKVVRQKSDSFS
jgi:hypothetical protein